MRKILPLLVISILVISGLGAVAFSEGQRNYIEETVFFSNPLIQEKEEFISIDFSESTANIMETGKPMLPKYTRSYTLPFGAKIKNVEVTFSKEKIIELSKPVIPSPERLIVTTLSKSTVKDVVVDYSEIDIYPEKRYSYKTGVGLDNGRRVTFLTVDRCPIQYSPSENLVYYSDTAYLEVKYSLPIKPVTFLDEYDFLILAPSEYKSALQPLADYKNGKDVKTLIKTLEEIPSTGTDQQESIKYYIKDAIENWGITYLLIVGAGEKDKEIFPVRYAHVPSEGHEDSFPSDLYYADIYKTGGAFSSWDADGDGKYAEVKGFSNDISELDMYPDVYIARIPANNVNELSGIVDKIINYYKHNKMMKTIAQIGGDTFPGDDEKINEGEYANTKVMENLPGYNTRQIWASNGHLSKQEIANQFNSGVDFVDFSGHGSYLSWATHAPEDDNVWLPEKTLISPYEGFLYVDFDLYAINNVDKLPVLTFNACSTSKYSEGSNCISYKALKKANGGSIATFGASGIGYGSHGKHETERVWGWMEVDLHKEMFDNKILGLCWANSLNGYVNSFYPGEDWEISDYKTVLEVTLFGDPTLAIQDGEDPKSRSIERTQITDIIHELIERFPRFGRLFNIIKNISKI